MQYELSDQEARHIEKYRALSPAGQGAIDLFMKRISSIQSEIDRADAERKSTPKN